MEGKEANFMPKNKVFGQTEGGILLNGQMYFFITFEKYRKGKRYEKDARKVRNTTDGSSRI